jgi:hypothetical protein
MSEHTVSYHRPEDNFSRDQNTPQDQALSETVARIAASVVADELEIRFAADGTAHFEARTFNPERLYRRLQRLLEHWSQYPCAVRCAAGVCDGQHSQAATATNQREAGSECDPGDGMPTVVLRPYTGYRGYHLPRRGAHG